MSKVTIKRDNTIAARRPDLLEEWDWEKNKEIGLDPNVQTCGSRKRAWWNCKSGHSWDAVISSRTGNNCGCPYCSNPPKRVLAGFNDLATLSPELAAQWHPTKNGSVTPQMVSPQSGKKAWWICELNHEWDAVIQSRYNGTGCPICSGRKALIGFNDLATTCPEVASSWDYELNGDDRPENYTKWSNKKFWWHCNTCLGKWKTGINDRTRGSGCPFCAGQKVLIGFNDLATTNPALASEWHPELNGDLTPNDVTAGSSVSKIWWRCKRGHDYEAYVYARTAGSGCPYCAGKKVLAGFNDLSTTHPAIAAEWHPYKNNGVTPSMVTFGTRRKFWFRCDRNHDFQAILANRTVLGQNCPYCAGQRVIPGENDLATCAPEIAKEWNKKKNGKLTPRDVMKASGKKAWWICKNKHEWASVIANRTTLGEGCPYCRQGKTFSYPEKAVFYYISKVFSDAVANSHGPNGCLGRRSVDIYIPSLGIAVEYDGYHWHQDIADDLIKDQLCNENGIRLIRIREEGCPKYDANVEIISRSAPFTSITLNEAISEVLAMLIQQNPIDVDVDRDSASIDAMMNGKDFADVYSPEQLKLDLSA